MTKYELLQKIDDLETRLAEEHRLRLLAESDVESSRPYELLLRRYEVLQHDYDVLLAEVHLLRNPERPTTSPRNPQRGRKPSIDADTRDKVVILHREGDSIRTISKALGISVGSVQNIVHEHTLRV